MIFMMVQHKSNILFLFQFLLLLIAGGFVSSCQEDEHDYAYCVVNNTGQVVNLQYTVASESRICYDTIQPGQTDTLCWRYNVTGKNVWNVETASEVYMFSSLQADIPSGRYTDNLRLRSYWGAVEDRNGDGFYTLNIVDSLFSIKTCNYYYALTNNSGYDINYTVTVGLSKVPITQPAGGYFMFGPYSSLQKYILDIYSEQEKISQITLSAIEATTDVDTLYSNYNPNKTSNWSFESTLVNGDSAGVYSIEFGPEIFK